MDPGRPYGHLSPGRAKGGTDPTVMGRQSSRLHYGRRSPVGRRFAFFFAYLRARARTSVSSKNTRRCAVVAVLCATLMVQLAAMVPALAQTTDTTSTTAPSNNDAASTTPPDNPATTPPTPAPSPTTTTAPAVTTTTAPPTTTTTAPPTTTTTAPVPGETASLIVRTKPGLTDAQQAAAITRHGGTETSSIAPLRLHVVDVPIANVDAAIAAYNNDADVGSVSRNETRAAESAASDPGYGAQWALPKIGWEDVHGVNDPTGSATIAVLDTGVDGSNPDLAGRVVGGWAFDNGDPATDPNGHGTSIASIAAARADDGNGIAGVAYTDGIRVMPVRVLGADGLGTDADIIEGLVYAVDHGANVVVMAFSNPGYSQALQVAVDYAWSNGVVLVAAAGNDGSSSPAYPSGDAKVVGVGGTDSSDAVWGGSNTGDAVFLGAPGVGIAASNGTVTGTSASAAYVAGAAALLRAADPSASNATIGGRLARTADPVGGGSLGNGRVNVGRAISDTSPDGVAPGGAPGGGGPIVGPYVA